MHFRDYIITYVHVSVIHCFVADESKELPPPGTNCSEYMFKNSKRFSKSNYFFLYKIGFFYPVLTTITVGNCLTLYLSVRMVSLFLINPKLSFFSKATLSPLYIIGVPFGLSVKRRTLGTLGFSFKKVWIFPLVI